MLKKNKLMLFCSIISVLIGISIVIENDVYVNSQGNNIQEIGLENDFLENYENLPEIAESNNYNNIQSTIEAKISEYSSKGSFSQLYEPSLQATYYALYVFDAIGRIDVINQTEVFNYIMSNYDSNLGFFMDEYAYRYLDTDFLKFYYPFTTVLEVNCYAVLSLDILNKVDQINSQDFVEFIWSCYNPVTSGFLGQPYSAALTDYFITATMDNTYYAVQTLDLLIDTWAPYASERTNIVQFVNGLQVSEVAHPECGGFYNDAESSFNSLYMHNPNFLGSYYCVKTIEVFGLIGTVNIADYHQYLEHLYDSDKSFFVMKPSYYNYTNIVATALGIELSDLTGASIDVSNAVDFVLNNRNSQGTWDCSTDYSYHELIDIFQIVRSLSNYGATAQFTTDEKNQIANGLRNYESYKGYSLLSNDYTSMELLNTIVNSFTLFDKIPNLDIQGLYNKIESVYVSICESFLGSLNMESSMPLFRSFPIEYCNLGNRNYITEIDDLKSHKTMFLALDVLKQTFKLDDFGSTHDLLQIANNISKTQFLDGGYDNYGAFLPSSSLKYGIMPSEYKDKYVTFEYSYYAIKALELLADILGLGSVGDFSFNKGALYTFVVNNVVEGPSTIYFDPQYTNNVEILLQNTFFMVYVLKALNLYDLNNQKVLNFVEQNLDYTNIKNIYYSYKISEIIGLEIDFDYELTHSLVETLYSESLNEFYVTSDMEIIDQQIFYWICDMAKNDELRIDCNYTTSIELGRLNSIEVSFNNIILSEFGPYISVKFESDPFGTLNLEKQTDNTYLINFIIPVDPSCYPLVEGMLNVYEGSKIIGFVPISFQTTYNLTVNHKIVQDSDKISFEVNISYMSSTGPKPVDNSRVFAKVLINKTYFEISNFSCQELEKCSIFTLDYKINKTSDYDYKIEMIDDLNPTGLALFDLKINSSIPIVLPDPDPDPTLDPDPDPDPSPDSKPESFIVPPWLIILVAFIIALVIAYITRKKLVELFKGGSRKRKKKEPNYELIVQKEIARSKELDEAKQIMKNIFRSV